MNSVAIFKQNKKSYSEKPPFNPPSIYKEYIGCTGSGTDKDNEIYASVREVFKLLGLDTANFGTERWNPLGGFIVPGNTVLLKPNFVKHFSERKSGFKGMITQGSLIRVLVDYSYIALQGRGRIVIADGPMDDADFDSIVRVTGLDVIRKFYKKEKGFELEIYDLRKEKVVKKGEKIIERIKLKGDPAGYTAVDLGPLSEFKKSNLDYRTFRGAECDTDVMLLHHNEDKDEYLIANTFLEADAVINIAKLKTHKRSGVTLSLKNMVGITGDRNWLPHFNKNNGTCVNYSDDSDGKEGLFGSIKNTINSIKPLRDSLRQFVGLTENTKQDGNWHGNDIIWRTIIDLAFISRYADKKGRIKDSRQRKVLAIVDGIIGGEGDGPLNPRPKPSGALIGGFNEFSVDMCASRLMGFDVMKIPKFKNMSENDLKNLYGVEYESIVCASNVKDWDNYLKDFEGKCLNFKPHYGWKNYIEVKNGKK